MRTRLEDIEINVKRLELRPDDTLLVAVPDWLDPADFERIREAVEENLPDVNVLVITSNVELTVLAPAAREHLPKGR